MSKRNIKIDGFEDVILNGSVLNAVRTFQHQESSDYFCGLLDKCIETAILGDEIYTDEEALEIIRGLTVLKQQLGSLIPEYRDGGVLLRESGAEGRVEAESVEEIEKGKEVEGWEE